MNLREVEKWCLPSWRQALIILAPVMLVPLAVTSKEGRCAYVILVMAVYWVAEVLPIPVTALVPVFAFPLLGVLSTKELCLVYMKETNMMFLGGLTVALAVEYCDLHKRIALFVILNVGQSPRRLMTGFMITTMFLSMWISNTATTAMMVPIVDSILQQLYQTRRKPIQLQRKATPPTQDTSPKRMDAIIDSVDIITGSVDTVVDSVDSAAGTVNIITDSLDTTSPITNNSTQDYTESDTEYTDVDLEADTVMFAPPPNEEGCRLRDMCYLATAYAANLGGTGALTGTGPNLVIKGVMDASFPDFHPINFATWMVYNVPGMLLCGVLAWLWLQYLFIGFGNEAMFSPQSARDAAIAHQLRRKYRALGPFSFHEGAVLTLFGGLVLLWLFRSPGFVTGWADLFTVAFPDVKIASATPAMFIVFLLFIIPKNPQFLRTHDSPDDAVSVPAEWQACLSWQVVQSKLPWGIVLLLGGGYAIAEAADKSKLSVLIGEQLRTLEAVPKEATLVMVSLATALVTEAVSNVTTAAVLLPVLKDLSLAIKVNPVYLMVPSTLCCSYAFMLPVATAPNAFVFGAANMKTITMVRAGFVMNLICVVVSLLMINTLGVVVFDLDTFPIWANNSIVTG